MTNAASGLTALVIETNQGQSAKENEEIGAIWLCVFLGFELLSLTAFAYPRSATSRQLLRPEAPPRVEIHHDVYRIS